MLLMDSLTYTIQCNTKKICNAQCAQCLSVDRIGGAGSRWWRTENQRSKIKRQQQNKMFLNYVWQNRLTVSYGYSEVQHSVTVINRVSLPWYQPNSHKRKSFVNN